MNRNTVRRIAATAMVAMGALISTAGPAQISAASPLATVIEAPAHLRYGLWVRIGRNRPRSCVRYRQAVYSDAGRFLYYQFRWVKQLAPVTLPIVGVCPLVGA